MQLSEKDKYAIVNYREAGWSHIRIAKTLKINVKTVYLYVGRYREMEDVNRKTGSGRKPEVTNEMIMHVMNEIHKNAYYSIDELFTQVNETISITKYMIRKILFGNGYIYDLPPIRFPLSEEHKKKRLTFAISHLMIDWTKIIFLDETACWKDNKQVKRWHNPNNIYDCDVMYKHGSKCNVWGAITYNEKEIHVFHDNMNADKYVQILEDFLGNLHDDDHYILQDNDPKHTSKKARAFMEENKFKTLKFPSYSPDLNPLENIWGIFKTNVAKRNTDTINEFKQILYQEWNSIDQQYIQCVQK
jgi:transposase